MIFVLIISYAEQRTFMILVKSFSIVIYTRASKQKANYQTKGMEK